MNRCLMTYRLKDGLLKMSLTLMFYLPIHLLHGQNKMLHFNGKIWNSVTNTAEKDVKVSLGYFNTYLNSNIGYSTLLPTNFKEIQSDISDNNGMYQFSFNSNFLPNEELFILVEKTGFENTIHYILPGNFTSYEKDFALSPKVKNKEEEKNREKYWESFHRQKNEDKIADSAFFLIQFNQQKGDYTDNACIENVPSQVYVSNLHNGYNGTTNGSGYTGYISFDLYIAGVVHGEIGGITTNLETKKAQAVAARTYSLNRHKQELPVNIGQAYHDSPSESSYLGSYETATEVIKHNGEVIDAKYSARCNGDFTQHAYEGIWSPYTSCNGYGNDIPYLKSVPCSGHFNCDNFNESPCCNTNISTTNTSGYIYGHGVGLCQRGIEQFGEDLGWKYCDMLLLYYTDCCIANDNCESSNAFIPLCEEANQIFCGENYMGESSSNPSYVYNYGCNIWTESGPERVHTFQAQYSGKLTATLSNFTGDLDVYILGSCNPFDCVGEVYSNEAIFSAMEKDSVYYIVVDSDDGSNSAYDLLITCENTNEISSVVKPNTFSIYPNPASHCIFIKNMIPNTRVCIYNTMGVKYFEGQLTQNKVDISTFPSGVYFISFYGDDIKHKAFIKEH